MKFVTVVPSFKERRVLFLGALRVEDGLGERAKKEKDVCRPKWLRHFIKPWGCVAAVASRRVGYGVSVDFMRVVDGGID